jgi:A/G-specific adenine glycosylase
VELLELPGVGRYTAGAVRAFAFDLPGAVVDGNVARVLARLWDFRAPVDDTAGCKQLAAWAELLEDAAAPRVHNSALMELGQTHCRPGVPDCARCPVARWCRAEDPAALPVKRQRTTVTEVDEHALWVRDRQGRLLLHHADGKRRTGLWQLPLREAAAIGHWPVVAELKYTITRYRVTLRVHRPPRGTPAPGPGESWVSPDQLARLPLAAPFRRAVTRLLENP